MRIRRFVSVRVLTLGGDHVERILVFASSERYRFRELFWWMWWWWSRNDGIVCENSISIYIFINNNRWGSQMLGSMISRPLNRNRVREKYSLHSVGTTWPRGRSQEILSSEQICPLHSTRIRKLIIISLIIQSSVVRMPSVFPFFST